MIIYIISRRHYYGDHGYHGCKDARFKDYAPPVASSYRRFVSTLVVVSAVWWLVTETRTTTATSRVTSGRTTDDFATDELNSTVADGKTTEIGGVVKARPNGEKKLTREQPRVSIGAILFPSGNK